jgi:hypothetical protein
MVEDDLAWRFYREPLRTTLVRTGTIALVAGAIWAASVGRLVFWPVATVLVLWVSFGGHFVELLFLNGLRPRLPATPAVQVAARIAVWFIGGIMLAVGMALTAKALAASRPVRWPAWWVAGLAFIAIELVVHLVLWMRGRPSFYDGRG